MVRRVPDQLSETARRFNVARFRDALQLAAKSVDFSNVLEHVGADHEVYRARGERQLAPVGDNQGLLARSGQRFARPLCIVDEIAVNEKIGSRVRVVTAPEI